MYEQGMCYDTYIILEYVHVTSFQEICNDQCKNDITQMLFYAHHNW